MKKSFYLICFFIFSLFLFKQPISAKESEVIKLSELEDGQRLEIQDKDVILELDTDKTLSDIILNNCNLVITGAGTLTLDRYEDFSVNGLGSQVTMEDGSIVNDNGGIFCFENFVMNGGNIVAPWSPISGDVILNEGSIDCYYFASDSDGSVFNINGGELHVAYSLGFSKKSAINISGGEIECLFIDGSELNICGGHIKCSSAIDCSVINIDENMTILTPRNDDFTDGVIRAYSGFGNQSGEIIQIVPISEVTQLEGISIDTASYTLGLNESVDLNVIFSPENASNKYLKWNSSDYSVVYVDQNGRAQTKRYGNAVITAISEDGNYTASCEIKVERSKDSQKGLVFEFKPNGPEAPQLVRVTYDGIAIDNSDYQITYAKNEENGNYVIAVEDIVEYIMKFQNSGN